MTFPNGVPRLTESEKETGRDLARVLFAKQPREAPMEPDGWHGTRLQRGWLAVANWALRRAGLGRIAALQVVEWDDASEWMEWTISPQDHDVKFHRCSPLFPVTSDLPDGVTVRSDGLVEIDFKTVREGDR